MRRELEDSLRKYTAWMRRTNRLYRAEDAGGRPVPEKSKNIMHQKPYYLNNSAKKGDETIEQAGAQETGKTESN